MFCKKCGADIGQGYPVASFCHMCGVDLKPEVDRLPSSNTGVQRPKITFTRRSLPKRASTMILIGAILCFISMFMYWIPDYDNSSTVRVPRSQDIYHRNDYGDLKSIETRSWYDTYKTGGYNSGYTGNEMGFGGVTLLVSMALIGLVFFKVNYPMPDWVVWLPMGTFIYLIFFWVIGIIQGLFSAGIGMGAIVFPIGLVLLYMGNKKLSVK